MTLPFERVPDAVIETGLPRQNSRGVLDQNHSLSFNSQSQGKVLVAEDDPVSRKIVLRMLEKAGQETIAAKDGLEAVEIFEKHRQEISLILMDVQVGI